MTLLTAAPPTLESATNTEEIPKIPLESSAQYNVPQQLPAVRKQNTEKPIINYQSLLNNYK